MKKITNCSLLFLLLFGLSSCAGSTTIGGDPVKMRQFNKMSNNQKLKNIFSGKIIAPSREPNKVIKIQTYGFFQNLKEDSIISKDIESSFKICQNPEFATVNINSVNRYIMSFTGGYIFRRDLKVWCK
jgi:hypothetical protein